MDTPKLYLFGGVRLLLDGGAQRLTARKQMALLSFIALQKDACAPRDLLAGLVWSDASDARARASLRQCLSELRAVGPEVSNALRIDRAVVGLDRSVFRTDLDDIREALDRGEVIDALRKVSPHDFLYGFESLGEGMADWIREARSGVYGEMIEALQSNALREDWSVGRRKQMAETALSLDPLSERSCRLAMQLAAEAGDLGSALQTYAAFYARMEAELDMEPSVETQDLAAEIKMGALQQSAAAAAAHSDPPAPKPASAETPPLENGFGQPVLAVLPVRVSREDADLSEMLTDDVILKLARFPEVSVISRLSIRHMAERPDAVEVLRDRFQAGYVLGGRLRRAGKSCNLALELARTTDGLVVWAETLDVDEADLFDVQGRASEQVVRMVLPRLHQSELRHSGDFAREHLSAYQRLLRARELMYALTPETSRQAGAILLDLTQTHPDFAPAWLAKADWHSLRVGQNWSQNGAADGQELDRCLTHILTDNPRNARALAMLGHHKIIHARRHAEALPLFEEAIASMPGDAETLLWTGPGLAYAGHPDRALDSLRRARSLSPDDPLGFRYDHFLGVAHLVAGNLDDAARLGAASLRNAPYYGSNLRLLAGVLAALDRVSEARAVAAQIVAQTPNFRVAKAAPRMPFADPAMRSRFAGWLRAAGLPN